MGFNPIPPNGNPTASRITFRFDDILNNVPTYTRVNLGPGTFQTRGFAPQGVGGWQPKSGQKIVGAGIDVTTLQLVGAGVVKVGEDLVEQHYHAIGMPIVPSGQAPIAPLEHFEISGLTIDCNLDDQPLRGQGTYTPVACGAIRILGNHCRIEKVKAIHWGTKSLREGCFVFSLIAASAEPTDGQGNPTMTETAASGIQDCIAIEPSQNNARETTVLHIGGLRNSDNRAQGFGFAPFLRNNFVDCSFKTAANPPVPFGSHFLTSGPGTTIIEIEEFIVGEFVSKRPHMRTDNELVRFYNPRDPSSRWNGYFPVFTTGDDYKLQVDLTNSSGTDDSSLVLLGTEFRGMAVTSCRCAEVEGNQIYNCWIGGPYQSLLDDSVSQPSTPPTLEREERLDPLNALTTMSLIVRGNTFRRVAVGPYWNAGGLSGAVASASPTGISYDSATGLVTVTTTAKHKLWFGARVKIESAPNPAYEGLQEITAVTDLTFKYRLAANLTGLSSGTASYRVVSGVDYLVIEGNTIELADQGPFPGRALGQFQHHSHRKYGI